jgi:hypothetical protein
VKGRLERRTDLRPADRAAMLRLLDAHFEGVTPATFERDLAEKNWVLLLEDEGELLGFSTLLVYETEHEGEPLTVVYSGDTIVDRRGWGSSALARCWIGSVRALRVLHPRGRLYWLLLSSGVRTYRFLPVFWRDFHPRFDADTPPDVAARLAFLAAQRLGPSFCRESGVARLAAPQVLRPELRAIPPARTEDPHATFFVRRNPGWAEGDELVCLTEIAVENLTPAGQRMWREGGRTLDVSEAGVRD